MRANVALSLLLVSVSASVRELCPALFIEPRSITPKQLGDRLLEGL